MMEPVLRRKVLRPRPRAAVEDASALARALPRAAARAFSAGAGLTVTAGAVTERRLALGEALERLDDDGFIGLLAAPGREGAGALVVLDAGLFAALIEVLTVGRLGPAPSGAPRRPTATDAALLGAAIDRLLAEVARQLQAPGAAETGPAPAPAAGVNAGPWQLTRGVTDPRLLGAILDEGRYVLADLPLRLATGQGADRGGRLALLLPEVAPAPAVSATPAGPDPVDEAFARALDAAVGAAPAMLSAVLGRLELPLAQVLELAVGQRLELPLAALEEVEIVGPDGQGRARARLGQSRGMRAVRLTVLDPAPALPGAPAFVETAAPAAPALADLR